MTAFFDPEIRKDDELRLKLQQVNNLQTERSTITSQAVEIRKRILSLVDNLKQMKEELDQMAGEMSDRLPREE